MQRKISPIFGQKLCMFDEKFMFFPKCRNAEFSAFHQNSQNVQKCRNAEENKPNFRLENFTICEEIDFYHQKIVIG